MNYYKKYLKFNDYDVHTFIFDNIPYLGNFNDFFKPIYINGKKTNYVVDIRGNIYSDTRKNHLHKKLKPVKSSGGYLRVKLMNNVSYSVHRLVASAFIENPHDKPDVNHIDGNKTHNYVENLEWATKSENVIHAYKNNLNSNKGEINPNAKLTKKDVKNIWKMINKGKSFTEISDKFNISRQTISNIYHGNTWKDMYNKYNINVSKNKSIKYSDDQIILARKMILDKKKSMKEISQITGVNLNYLYSLKLNKYRKDI